MTYDYDAIVLDLMLPKIDGWEVLERLRQSKSTPVMILSALDQRVIAVEGSTKALMTIFPNRSTMKNYCRDSCINPQGSRPVEVAS